MCFDFYPLLRPLLFALPPERAHALGLAAARCAHSLGLTGRAAQDPSAAVTLMGLRFPNRVGLAAGFDKNARYIDALGALGFGFIEVGTVTPRPQSGQMRARLFRLPQAGALINRMGFPNDGAAAVAARLSGRAFAGVCGVNIGKNASTPIAAAVRDYLECFRVLAPCADYIAINVSSPNTLDLRRLQECEQLRPILEALLDAREQLAANGGIPSLGSGNQEGRHFPPLLVKISPDLAEEDLHGIAQLIRRLGIDGVIATNTTVSRPATVQSRWTKETGGLSGAPLRPLAIRAIRTLRGALGPTMPIIAVGGIASARDALAATGAGADLVQVYTGLIYRGPRLIPELVAALRTSAPGE